MPTYDTADRYALRALTGGNPVSDIDAGFAALRDDISAKLTPYTSGLLSARPTSTGGTPGKAGRLYRATDDTTGGANGTLYYDHGTGWIALAGLDALALPGHEIGYDQIINQVTALDDDNETDIIVAAAHTFDGAPVMAEFFSPNVSGPRVDFYLDDNSGRKIYIGSATANAILCRTRITPSAGSHSYTVGAYGASASIVGAGTGTNGQLVPAYLRFTKV